MNSVVRQVEDDVQKTLEKCVEITVEDCKKYNVFKRIAGHLLRIIAPLM